MEGTVRIAKSKSRRYKFNIISSAGEVVATSPSFTSKVEVLKALIGAFEMIPRLAIEDETGGELLRWIARNRRAHVSERARA